VPVLLYIGLFLHSAGITVYRSVPVQCRYYCISVCSCTVPVLLSDFNDTLMFSTDFPKIPKYQSSRNFVQWQPSCSMRTEGQTDMTNLTVAFRNIANAPITSQLMLHREIIAVGSDMEIHVHHIHTPCGQNVINLQP
jgi:hypothetical protein